MKEADRVLRVLLIEDDADDAELTLYALRRFTDSHPVLHIDDGERALEYLFGDQELPSLILLDLKMPRVDGVQILRELKNDPIRNGIPVVALISSREGKSYLESFDVKADAYMIKPVDSAQFSAVLRQVGLLSDGL